MLRLIKNSGYHGYIGVEYEGTDLSEDEGIRRSKKLLERWQL
jgi:hydroxypyruvate isomerase